MGEVISENPHHQEVANRRGYVGCSDNRPRQLLESVYEGSGCKTALQSGKPM